MDFKKFIRSIISFVTRQMARIVQIIRTFFHNIQKKGPEHLTIMMIPHSEKRIFTLHIKYFTLFFIGTVLLIIIIISAMNILSTSTTQQEVHNLIRLSKSWKIKEKIIRDQIDQLNEDIGDLKPEIEKLYSSASEKENYISLFAQGGSSEPNTDILKEKISEKLPDEYYDLEQIKNDIAFSKKYIRRVQTFIKEREELFSKMPSIWPLKVGGHITSGYGWRKNPFGRRKPEWHRGIDIASWPGAPIVATSEGIIKLAGWKKGYGLTVIIKHAYGFETHYAHLSRIRAYAGKKIKKGDIIGFLGRTGLATGYHLHYEIRIGLQDVNPWPYIMNIK